MIASAASGLNRSVQWTMPTPPKALTKRSLFNVIDRVIHRAHVLALTGPSRRKEAGTRTAAAEPEAVDAAGDVDTTDRHPPLLGDPAQSAVSQAPTAVLRLSQRHTQQPRAAHLPKDVAPIHWPPPSVARSITPARGAAITMVWTA